MSKSDYGVLDRALHRIALGNRLVRQSSYDIESILARDGKVPKVTQPVFIAGLARSGSTILLNALYQTGCFRSLTYRDMPFVLMPGVWKKLSLRSRVSRIAKERAHKDRLLVEYDSPEALEEVFWSTFSGDAYIFKDKVVPYKPARSVSVRFREYVAHIMASRDDERQNRYLAKNNNNLLRLGAIKFAFPDAKIIVPFREPMQQALSLLRQHELFIKMHRKDHFSMQYMNWLGHYEFGLGHKSYAYCSIANPFYKCDVSYWLQSWKDAYNFALDNAPPDTIFVSYESLCADPVSGFGTLFPALDLDADPAVAAKFYLGADRRAVNADEAHLGETCATTYSRLMQLHAAL